MLIRANIGQNVAAVPIATMASAYQLSNGNWRVTASDGETHDFSNIDWEIALETTPIATLPALPGTYLISANTEDDEPPFWKSNVLGWTVCMDNVVRPAVIDPEGVMHGWTALHPDGRVEAHNGTTWDNTTDWLASQSAGS